ncbi:hypothetical protein [Roseateles koreensis]|uniref:STAS/SEC14 domain-containing protein n=1 Tax=Roseateles koreensis TaxID=2987526 RepID=A0ABT5KPZ9_9BURK|nr:hypothetical protein [Roseateles koreensis]MDC8784997.1 hypothetical protein [Roseateles koreensis]
MSVSYIGAWNVEAVLALHADAKKLWGVFNDEPWAMLTDATLWDGGTPDVFQRWWEFFTDAASHGMTTVTDVLPSSFHAVMVKDLAQKASQISNYRHSANIEEAVRWLGSQGFRKG